MLWTVAAPAMTLVPAPEQPLNSTKDPVQPVLQAAVYVLLTVAPVSLFAWLFLFVFNQFVGSILAVLSFALLGNFICLRTFDGAGLERLGMPWNRPGFVNTWRGILLGFGSAALVVVIPLM